MTTFKLSVIFFLTSICSRGWAGDCIEIAENINDYLPDIVAEFLPIKKYICGETELKEFKVSGSLAKLHSESKKRAIEKMHSIPLKDYSFMSSDKLSSDGVKINLEKENQAASRVLTYIRDVEPGKLNIAIIVPGFSEVESKKPLPLDPIAQERVDLGVRALMTSGASVIIFSGGNVHPEGTLYNEAFEMKRYAIKRYQVPDEMIAIDPFARHSTTNLRNSGRFMLVHGLKKALIVTSPAHNFYFGFASRSSFEERARAELGYFLGKLEIEDVNTTTFFPSNEVMKRGSDPKDI